MRAHLHARRPRAAAYAEIAFGRQIDVLLQRRAVERHFDDVVPRAALDAVAAADARLRIDRHFERAHCARDRAGRTADETHRIAALITRDRHRPVLIARALANEPR